MCLFTPNLVRLLLLEASNRLVKGCDSVAEIVYIIPYVYFNICMLERLIWLFYASFVLISLY